MSQTDIERTYEITVQVPPQFMQKIASQDMPLGRSAASVPVTIIIGKVRHKANMFLVSADAGLSHASLVFSP